MPSDGRRCTCGCRRRRSQSVWTENGQSVWTEQSERLDRNGPERLDRTVRAFGPFRFWFLDRFGFGSRTVSVKGVRTVFGPEALDRPVQTHWTRKKPRFFVVDRYRSRGLGPAVQRPWTESGQSVWTEQSERLDRFGFGFWTVSVLVSGPFRFWSLDRFRSRGLGPIIQALLTLPVHYH